MFAAILFRRQVRPFSELLLTNFPFERENGVPIFDCLFLRGPVATDTSSSSFPPMPNVLFSPLSLWVAANLYVALLSVRRGRRGRMQQGQRRLPEGVLQCPGRTLLQMPAGILSGARQEALSR
ncbi:unnamed protein product [Protopolystoma xenopodis]|uniref:Uncharacterized protein n=1 Tax=Protopolystoma xenopodis TaxID=117903 RepID=A0A3S5CGG7_9PLAT|nr:unnamed protein product [Protopolystoma xenopodis]